MMANDHGQSRHLDAETGSANEAEQQIGVLASHIEDLRPADAAAVLTELPAPQLAAVMEYLDPATAADILAAMDASTAASALRHMHPPEASRVLAAMHPDDRVDVLEELPAALHETLLKQLEPSEAAEVRNLEQYPPDTAGGIMTTQVTALPEHLTVEQAIAELRRLSETLEQMFYVYVTDAGGRLVGVLSMRDLILARPGRLLSEILRPEVVSVPALMDQEEVARIMRKYGYLALPVVDAGQRLLGLVTVDDVVQVLEEEATEDVQKLFGAGAEERLTSSWSFSFRKRILWLEVNLLTAFLAASVVGWFEATIAEVAILAMYMPIVAGMGGNASAQAMAVAIRGIALGEVDRALLKRVLRRELIVGFLSGMVVGATAIAIAGLFHYQHGILLGVLAGAALLVNHALACVWGATIPFVMKSLGFDPAQSATIFTTTLTDMVGFFTLLGLATLVMGWLR